MTRNGGGSDSEEMKRLIPVNEQEGLREGGNLELFSLNNVLSEGGEARRTGNIMVAK